MTKHLLFALSACTSIALAQTPKPEVITHLNDLDIEVEAMGVPTATTEAGGELVGIRAIRVMNNTGEMVTCEFHVPADARASTSAPPVFNVNPNSQRAGARGLLSGRTIRRANLPRHPRAPERFDRRVAREH